MKDFVVFHKRRLVEVHIDGYVLTAETHRNESFLVRFAAGCCLITPVLYPLLP